MSIDTHARHLARHQASYQAGDHARGLAQRLAEHLARHRAGHHAGYLAWQGAQFGVCRQGPRRQGACRDAGQVTAFTVVMFVAVMVFAGLVLDGGLALAAKVRALNEAQEAARSGAQALDLTAYRVSGDVVLDRQQAAAAAHRYLAATGNPNASSASVAVTDDQVTVTVSRRQATQILRIVGMSGITVDASATARAAHGVNAPEP
jgi:hypothetical protein